MSVIEQASWQQVGSKHVNSLGPVLPLGDGVGDLGGLHLSPDASGGLRHLVSKSGHSASANRRGLATITHLDDSVLLVPLVADDCGDTSLLVVGLDWCGQLLD